MCLVRTRKISSGVGSSHCTYAPKMPRADAAHLKNNGCSNPAGRDSERSILHFSLAESRRHGPSEKKKKTLPVYWPWAMGLNILKAYTEGA